MKIWIDILTPKQLLFFGPMVERLQKRHAVLCTGRRYWELSNLAEIRKMRLRFVGRHGGKDRGEKLRASIRRMQGLQRVVERERPDVAVSFCSPEASRVAFGLGIGHVGFTDSPHAVSVMKMCVPLVQKLLIPSIMPKSEFVRFGIREKDIVKYGAIDAGVIAKRPVPKEQTVPFDRSGKTILVRMEEEQAAYISKKSASYSIIEGLSGDTSAEIVVLGRYPEQIKRLKSLFGGGIKVLARPYDGKVLLTNVDLFVGSGGTMTAEAALLGTPTISYNAVPNFVEEYLVRRKVITREEDPAKIAKIAKKILAADKSIYAERSKRLVRRMKDPYPVLVDTMNLLK